jgi:hypothetical protein
MKTQEQKLAEVQELADSITSIMDAYVHETATNETDENEDIAENERLVKELIAKARELGRDFSGVIR